MTIEYSLEETPLGMAGFQTESDLEETFLLVKGDLLADRDFAEFIASHRARNATATIGRFERRPNRLRRDINDDS